MKSKMAAFSDSSLFCKGSYINPHPHQLCIDLCECGCRCGCLNRGGCSAYADADANIRNIPTIQTPEILTFKNLATFPVTLESITYVDALFPNNLRVFVQCKCHIKK